jgi:Cysteine-rich secretory protein family
MRKKVVLPLFVFVAIAAFAQSAQWAQQEQELVKQLNASRREAGLPPLTANPKLTEAARKHSEMMAEQNKLSHVLPGEPAVAARIAATGLHFNRSGENVGYNTDFSGIHSGFMNSPPHRANILSPDYAEVGIGVVHDDKGVWWATQDFAHTLEQKSANQAEDLAAEKFAELRSAAGTPALKRINSTRLHDLACNMGHAGKLDPRQVLSIPGVHYAITYNNSRPEALPSSANSLADKKGLTQYSVGACFVQEKSNPGGTYYVLMAFY